MWYHLMYHRDNANLLEKFSSRRIAVKIGGLHCRSLESAKVDDVIVYREDFWQNYRARWAKQIRGGKKWQKQIVLLQKYLE